MIRAGIIGLGRIGHGFGVAANGDPLCHSESYARRPDVALRLGIDPSLEARARFSTRFPQAAVCTSADNAPSDLRLEVISVAGPTETRAANIQAALRFRPRVVLAEKPLAQTSAEAARITAACAEAGCTLLVNYSRRWSPLLPLLRQAISPDGRLGAPSGATIRYNGGLRHNGTHWIDLLVALFGRPSAVSTTAIVKEAPSQENETDDARSLALTWSDAGMVVHLIALGSPGWSIGEGEFWSPRGLLSFGDAGQRLRFRGVKDSRWAGFHDLAEEERLTDEGLRGHLENAVREAVTLALEGGTPSCSGADAITVLEVVERARKGG